jgi:hypothetical protein
VRGAHDLLDGGVEAADLPGTEADRGTHGDGGGRGAREDRGASSIFILRALNRLLRPADFLRVTGAAPSLLPRLARLATVQSGRPGIAPEAAPPGLLGPPPMPGSLTSPPSGTNVLVLLDAPGAPGPRPLGEFHAGPEPAAARLLALH